MIVFVPFLTDKPINLTFFKKEQIHNSNELDSVPAFIIEIISPSNTVTEIEKKLQDYFHTGVRVVWLLFPELPSVKIYTSIKSVRICTDNDICDAGDTIPDFQISVSEIFK